MWSNLERLDKRARDAVQMISHRYPALEFYAKKMGGAVEGVEINTQLFFHREDLFDESGDMAPAKFTEYRALAEKLHSPLRAGTISCPKPVDAALNEMHWYMNALGAG